MVSTIALLDGLTAGGIIFSSAIFGIISLYEAKKYRIRLLAIAGLTMFFCGIFWLGPFCDLLSVSLTGNNLSPMYLYAILSYVWIYPGVVIAMYLGAEILTPKEKWYILSYYIVSGLIFELFLFFDTENVFIFTLHNPGEDLIDVSFNRTHICYYIIVSFLVSAFIFLGMGLLIKAKQSEGVVRKKFIYLSIGYQIFVISGIVDGLTSPGSILFLARLFMMTFAVWMYLGLRVEPERKVKLKPKKEITVEGALFRISHTKPEEITEEQITFYKEQKICLVCKGKAIRYIYICPKCETLYCEHCARTVENIENACWYCGIPFDESKPIRPYKKEEAEVVDMKDIIEKPKKRKVNK